MFEDILLILIAVGGAFGATVADNAHLYLLVWICVSLFTIAIFCMGYRSARRKVE
jgi:uncharacterized membrane protein YsdA (DUF1294 family)